MTDMSKQTIHHYGVSFEAAKVYSGGSFIALAVTQGEGPLDHGTMFFLEPKEGITADETARLAALLNKCIARFGVVPGAEAP